MNIERDFDEAAEAVHRAFCYPDHELVSQWDQDMADALHRRGLVISSAKTELEITHISKGENLSLCGREIADVCVECMAIEQEILYGAMI